MIQEEIEEGNSCCDQTKTDSPMDGQSHLTQEKGLVTIGGKEKLYLGLNPTLPAFII